MTKTDYIFHERNSSRNENLRNNAMMISDEAKIRNK